MAHIAQGETANFQAQLGSPHVIAGGESASTSTASAFALFTLTWDPTDTSTAQLSYDIQLENADLDGLQTPDLSDDVTAIHLHDVNQCVAAGCLVGDTAGTLHVLNIYGAPRHDDADLEVVATESRLTGRWDRSDANNLTPAPSFAPADFLEPPWNGELFLMVHTREFPSGAFGGFLVPEPHGIELLSVGVLVFSGFVRRARGLIA